MPTDDATTNKHFSDAELMAEFWRQDGVLGAAGESLYPWFNEQSPHWEKFQKEQARSDALERFATTPSAV